MTLERKPWNGKWQEVAKCDYILALVTENKSVVIVACVQVILLHGSSIRQTEHYGLHGQQL